MGERTNEEAGTRMTNADLFNQLALMAEPVVSGRVRRGRLDRHGAPAMPRELAAFYAAWQCIYDGETPCDGVSPLSPRRVPSVP